MNTTFENKPIEIENLPKIVDLEFQSLDREYLFVSLLGNSIFCLLLGIGLTVFLLVNPLSLTPSLMISLIALYTLLVLFTFFITLRGFREKGYAVREKDITYKTGLLWRSLTVIPFNRIQHSEVKEGLLERLFDLSSLHVYTAGGSSSDLSIPGLKKDQAISIKEYVLEKINAEIESSDAE